MLHRYVSGSRLASLLAVPSSDTLIGDTTFWFTPALATGRRLSKLTVTASDGLAPKGSVTVSERSYEPRTSATKVGVADAGADGTALLPPGLPVKDHRLKSLQSVKFAAPPFSACAKRRMIVRPEA